MLSRDKFQNKWVKIVELGFSDYNSLSKNERVWFNVESVVTQGLIDHYINSGAEHNSDLIEDLDFLDSEEISNLFVEINNFFRGGKIPQDLDQIDEEIYSWSEDKKELLEKNERLFWNQSESLEIKLLTHINKYFLNDID